jgi:predicted ATPase
MNSQQDLLRQNPPIFLRFSLLGLNGYKDVSIQCNSPVKIACADNGSGKTSLLNAIYSVFVGQPSLLYSMDFDALEVTWATGGVSRWKKSELFGGLKRADLEKMANERFFSEWGIVDEDAIELMTKFILNDTAETIQTAAYKSIFRDSPYDRQEIFEQLSAIANPIIETGEFSTLHKRAQEALGEAVVLYLPTYRRIEADLPEFRSGQQSTTSGVGLRGRTKAAKSAWDSTKLIFFGMSDVETRLNSIVTQIRKETLEAYSRSNGQTLEELVESGPVSDNTLNESFDLSAIEVVLGRVGRNTGALKDRLKEMIDTGEIYNESRRELRRFLTQLLRVYAERREDEQAIEAFVEVVKKYISPEEVDGDHKTTSEKHFTFDKLRLELAVKNTITGQDIKFGALSSGEKQIVSIFARLMLDPRKRYLILIDEPELSLSLEWQQRLLPDIVSSSNCSQLIAITHSPFIFENEFATAAGTIDVRYVKPNGSGDEQ